jgi:hypothetical protein
MTFKLLNNDFNNLLTEYNSTYQEYIDILDKRTTTKREFKTLKNNTYLGKDIISYTNTDTVEDCQTACIDNPNCDGASFSASVSRCELLKGNGEVIPSMEHTAIIPNMKYYSFKLDQLNNKLITLNKKMQLSEAKEQEEIKERNTETNKNKILLEQNYQELLQERKEIQKIMKEYENVNSVYINDNLLVKMNYWWYVLLFILFILLLFWCIRFLIPNTKQQGGANEYILGIMPKKIYK